MGTCANKLDRLAFDPINQEPIRFKMTFITGFVGSFQWMISICGLQGFLLDEFANQNFYFVRIFAPPDSQFDILLKTR